MEKCSILLSAHSNRHSNTPAVTQQTPAVFFSTPASAAFIISSLSEWKNSFHSLMLLHLRTYYMVHPNGSEKCGSACDLVCSKSVLRVLLSFVLLYKSHGGFCISVHPAAKQDVWLHFFLFFFPSLLQPVHLFSNMSGGQHNYSRLRPVAAW